MNIDQHNFIKNLIESSKRINSKVFTLTRCILLVLMKFNKDGIQYREFKTLLNISDGKLKSNLDFLEELEYIKKVQIQLDKKKMHIYLITVTGENEIDKIIKWIRIFGKVEEI